MFLYNVREEVFVALVRLLVLIHVFPCVEKEKLLEVRLLIFVKTRLELFIFNEEVQGLSVPIESFFPHEENDIPGAFSIAHKGKGRVESLLDFLELLLVFFFNLVVLLRKEDEDFFVEVVVRN